MNRRSFLTQLAWLPMGASLGALAACSEPGEPPRGRATVDAGPAAQDRLVKPLSEWRQILPANRFRVLFEEGTEPPGSSPLDREKRDGTFVCAACKLPLFESSMKYDSRTGWPSFTRSIPGVLDTKTDYKLILPRTEYHCIRCGGHQGHVFDDGPQPTGKRYCNNGLALEFVPDGTRLPDLVV